MNNAVRDSLSLGVTLAQILSLPPSSRVDEVDVLLDNWSMERRIIAKKIMRFTDQVTRITTISNPTLIWLRNKVMRWSSYWFPESMKKSTHQMSGLGYGRNSSKL